MTKKYVTVARFTYSTEAQIYKGRLEAENIEAKILNQYTIDTDPLISNAIGGVQLQVPEEQKLKARFILDQVSQQNLDDDGNTIQCPNCSSKKVNFYSNIKDFKSMIAYLIAIIFVVLPLYTRHDYTCEECGKKFNTND
ncbi:DUF2007 domain-containing protein [Mesonia sp. K7]|uniref:DUF2007 domain-containing protein n=1 Tax=Mesonia sp. K7 TaxID=2218606 RepID=UPI000DA97C79|nr:DUF2007 domain-containing protein [Mesonia sp. K7]PZD78972.1 DUF2007 domain-containing protein [Mesonia sp. K7]